MSELRMFCKSCRTEKHWTFPGMIVSLRDYELLISEGHRFVSLTPDQLRFLAELLPTIVQDVNRCK